jgi:hypothetical protein
MNAESLNDLQRRASEPPPERTLAEIFKNTNTEDRVKAVIATMKGEGKILELSDEEIRVVRALRRFKFSCKPGAMFKWQTRPSDSTELIVEPGEQVHITDPQDASGA